jgi:hypothetical protein
MNKCLVACLAGVLVILAAPTVFAQGTPNLGTADVLQQGSSFMFDARAFEATEAQDTLDNAVYTPGFAAAVNEKVDFSLMLSTIDVTSEEVIIPGNPASSDYLNIQRKVLAPMLKWRINGNDKPMAWTLSVGADVVMERNSVTRSNNTPIGTQYGSTPRVNQFDDFVPAARLQLQWGKPGKFQFQIAGQANIFGETGQSVASAQTSSSITGPDTVMAAGGGIVWPWGKKLSVVGDYMWIVDGNNAIGSCGQYRTDEDIWSAGLNWACKASNISVYATNSLAPTLVDSIMASPSNIVAWAARWSTKW